MGKAKKEFIIYFPNWKTGTENGNVSDIPWDKITMINHAFMKVVPGNGDRDTSFARREKGLPARETFDISSTNENADRMIFEEYRKYHEKYPDVKIMISIGGWCCCGYFSEMAYTEGGRKSFTEACVKLMEQHEWISGIDIDWEYPGGAEWGERGAEGDYNEGCPIWSSSSEDAGNFTLLLKAMRESFDARFGKGARLVTACAGAAMSIIGHQNWGDASKYLDYINIMTYDMANEKDGVAGHGSNVEGCRAAVDYLIKDNVDKAKINIGAPYYGTGFDLVAIPDNHKIIGAPIKPVSSISREALTYTFMHNIEKEAVDKDSKGWHYCYDEIAKGAYLYNDDEESDQYLWFISYDSDQVLKDKVDYILNEDIAGIIIWEITQDSSDHHMTEILSQLI